MQEILRLLRRLRLILLVGLILAPFTAKAVPIQTLSVPEPDPLVIVLDDPESLAEVLQAVLQQILMAWEQASESGDPPWVKIILKVHPEPPTSVPEPSAVVLALTGLAGLVVVGRRRWA